MEENSILENETMETGDEEIDVAISDNDRNSNVIDEKIVSKADRPEDKQLDQDKLAAYEREDEVAADYLEEFLDIIDMDGDFDIEIKNGRTYISINDDEGNELDSLIGEEGKVLNSLQELSRLVVLNDLGMRSRMILDIQNYRQQKSERIKKKAFDVVQKVKETGAVVHMSPASPFERKLIHDVIGEQGLNSESEGQGSERHVVVSPS